ncbi:MAG: type transporter [Dehalococcoidia bacterium]|nr:type transporter [Dehalococcoidia bacterium]
MSGLAAVFWKEIAEYFSSRRFLILLALIYLSGGWAIYNAANFIRSEVSASSSVFLLLFTASGPQGVPPSFVFFLALFVPIIGIAFGFDAINSERASGTLSRVLSQPIYRDSVVNGKFLAGLFTIATLLASILLLVSGVGLRMIGVAPELEEIARLATFFLVTVLYAGFWLALAILLSLLFSRPATSALAAIAIWLFFTFFIGMIAQAVAGVLVPVDQFSTEAEQMQYVDTAQFITRFSPATLFSEAMAGLLTPSLRALGMGTLLSQPPAGMLPNPLIFSQSFLLVWPQILSILVLTIICFALAYIKFMREEIRAT